LAASVYEFGQHNAFGFEELVETEVVLPEFRGIVGEFLEPSVPVLHVGPFFEIVMEGEAINKEIVDFKPIEFLLIFDEFNRQGFPFFADETYGCSFLKNANLGKYHFDLPVHFVDGVELDEKATEELLSFPLGELRLLIFDMVGLNNIHFLDCNFLA
jgi:hypothetical protein